MRYAPLESLSSAVWYAYSDEPIEKGKWYKPWLSDPCIIAPEESPDHLWHLFAHTWIGVEHFTSPSGFDWRKEKTVIFRGHSPSVYREGDRYFLVYEIHDRDYNGKKKLRDKKAHSRINMSISTDLMLWSSPKTILDSLSVPFASDYSVPRISRPQIVYWEGMYRLYFGASHSVLPDSSQKATSYLAYAESNTVDGVYTVNAKPMLGKDRDGKYTNLALGSVRIIPCSDGLAALNCCYYYDKDKKMSRSLLRLLTSADGIEFKHSRILLPPAEKGWASRYITGCDAIYREDESSWYCYYSANCHERKPFLNFYSESLGLLLGQNRR